MSLSTSSLPSAKVIHVDTRGAVILSEESPEVSRLRARNRTGTDASAPPRHATAGVYTYPTTLNRSLILQWTFVCPEFNQKDYLLTCPLRSVDP